MPHFWTASLVPCNFFHSNQLAVLHPPLQMLGLATSVAVLRALEAANQPEALIIPIWALVHAVHVVLRYRALSALRFPYPNQRMWVGGGGPFSSQYNGLCRGQRMGTLEG